MRVVGWVPSLPPQPPPLSHTAVDGNGYRPDIEWQEANTLTLASERLPPDESAACDARRLKASSVQLQLVAMEVERNSTSIWSSSAPSGVSATSATSQYVRVDRSLPPPSPIHCALGTVASTLAAAAQSTSHVASIPNHASAHSCRMRAECCHQCSLERAEQDR